MDNEKNKEKRKKVRIPFIYGIEFDDAEEALLIPDDPKADPSTKIVLKDVSADGLQIFSPQYLSQGTEIKLLIRFPRWRGVPKDVIVEDTQCVVHAKVCWIVKNQAEKGFRVGLAFSKLDAGAQELINRYLDDNIIVEDEVM